MFVLIYIHSKCLKKYIRLKNIEFKKCFHLCVEEGFEGLGNDTCGLFSVSVLFRILF